MYCMYPINVVDNAFVMCLHCNFLDKINTYCFLCLQYIIINILQKYYLRNKDMGKIKELPLRITDF